MRYTPGARRLSALHLENAKRRQAVHLTQSGYDKLKEEQERLLSERPEALEHLKKARELGDLSENGYYKASRAKLSQIDSRLFHIKMLLKTARIIEQSQTDTITLGSTVILATSSAEKVYMIVGRHEANPSQGRISDVSPLGRALLGKKVGETAIMRTPSGEVVYTIVKISS